MNITISRRALIIGVAALVVSVAAAVLFVVLARTDESASGPTKLVCEVTGSDGTFLGQRAAENTAWPCGMDLPRMREGDTVPGVLGAKVTLKRVPADQPIAQLTR